MQIFCKFLRGAQKATPIALVPCGASDLHRYARKWIVLNTPPWLRGDDQQPCSTFNIH
jgi:hypothetical protein